MKPLWGDAAVFKEPVPITSCLAVCYNYMARTIFGMHARDLSDGAVCDYRANLRLHSTDNSATPFPRHLLPTTTTTTTTPSVPCQR